LNLPEISGRLEEYIKAGQTGGGWSSNTMQITNAWVRDGLKSRCITRDLQWGVPVPIDHLKDKVPTLPAHLEAAVSCGREA
jgi:methionyl-tRNA synthetase